MPPKAPKKWFAKPGPIPEANLARSTEAIASRMRPRMASEELREVAQSRIASIADTSQPVAQDVARQVFDNPNPTAPPPQLQNPAAHFDDVPDPWENPVNVQPPKRVVAPPDPWNPHEGYVQGDLFGSGETIKQAYNPPAQVKNPNPTTADNEYAVQAHLPGLEPPGFEGSSAGLMADLRGGLGEGWNYSIGKGGFARSAIWHRAPREQYAGLNSAGQAGFLGGRLVGDIAGLGSRSLGFRIQPEDVVGTHSPEVISHFGGNRTAQVLGGYLANQALGIGSGNWNPLNLAQGGRAAGFAANSPTTDDPRESENPVGDLLWAKGMRGATGRLLPWEQFHQERPDVSYDKYAAYQEYMRDPGLLGLAKGTLDGVDGPEARIAGYRVTPMGALAAAGTVGLVAALARKPTPRIARI